MSQYVLLVREHNEDERLFGPYRSFERAMEGAVALVREITDEMGTPAWAYVVALESPTYFRLAEVRDWMLSGLNLTEARS